MYGFHKGPMGFQIDMENGWTVSIQWGIGNYCSNRSSRGNPFSDVPDYLECPDAEIAAWPTDSRGEGMGTSTNEWYTFEDGQQVKGWQRPTEVLAFINMISYKDHWVNEIEGGAYLSECCDAVEIGELSDNDGDLYRTGFCGRCKDNAIFTYEVR